VPHKLLTIQQALSLLAETPPRLETLTDGLSTEQLHRKPAPDGWSVNDVLAHLRACADVWGGAIERLVDQDRPTLRAVNPRTWIEHTSYLELEFGTSWRAFTLQRADLLALLEPLPETDWQRSGRIVGTGRPLEWSVLSYGDRLARHERAHLKQIAHVASQLRG
jgi:hypothetical protein